MISLRPNVSLMRRNDQHEPGHRLASRRKWDRLVTDTVWLLGNSFINITTDAPFDYANSLNRVVSLPAQKEPKKPTKRGSLKGETALLNSLYGGLPPRSPRWISLSYRVVMKCEPANFPNARRITAIVPSLRQHGSLRCNALHLFNTLNFYYFFPFLGKDSRPLQDHFLYKYEFVTTRGKERE